MYLASVAMVAAMLALGVEPTEANSLTRDTDYTPRAGDFVLVGYREVTLQRTTAANAFIDERAFDAYWKASAASDRDLIDRLQLERMVEIAPGTKAKILRINQNTDKQDVPASALLHVWSGSYKDRQLWVHLEVILRKADRKAIASDPAAASLLKAGQNLEKLGKKPAALEFYTKIASEYHESTEAATAVARIRALGGKVPDQSKRPAPKAITPLYPLDYTVRPPKPSAAVVRAGSKIVLTDVVITPTGIDGSFYIDGRLKNVSAESLDTVAVDISLEDASGKFLGTSSAITTPATIAVGGTATFKAIDLGHRTLDHVKLEFTSRGKAIPWTDLSKTNAHQ